VNEVRKPEWQKALPDLSASFSQAGSVATRRLCEQGQAAVKTMSEWNGEIFRFFNGRLAHNGELIGRMTNCQSPQEIFAIQAQWAQDAADDYLKEISKLTELNSQLMGGLLRTDDLPQ